MKLPKHVLKKLIAAGKDSRKDSASKKLTCFRIKFSRIPLKQPPKCWACDGSGADSTQPVIFGSGIPPCPLCKGTGEAPYERPSINMAEFLKK